MSILFKEIKLYRPSSQTRFSKEPPFLYLHKPTIYFDIPSQIVFSQKPMTYKEFILSLPLQDDATINWMQKFVREDSEFPDTKNVEDIAKRVYLLFNHKQTLAFQKSLIMFLESTGDSSIKK